MSKLVRILLGSKSDSAVGEEIKKTLDSFGVEYDYHISSAHRKPENTAALAKNAKSEGIKVIIAGAGMAAHLPGVVASHTTLPVIGVPLKSKNLDGMDALLSVAQMPPGVPVATVAIDGGKNAAILACQIIACFDENVSKRLADYKQSLAQ